MKKIYSLEGILGLYKGLAPNLVGIIPEKAIKLAVNDYARDYWAAHSTEHPDRIHLSYGMLSGATAGVCQVVATNPMEVVKIQMQLAGARPGVPVSAIKLVQTLGFKGLYRGTGATLARDVPFSVLFFSLVSVFKEWGTVKGEATGLATVFGSGVVAGAIAAASVTPVRYYHLTLDGRS